MNLLKQLAITVKAALIGEELRAAGANDAERYKALRELHADLADVAVKHFATLGFDPAELDGLVHTDGGGTPKAG